MVCYEDTSVMNFWYKLTNYYIIHRVDGKSEIEIHQQLWGSVIGFGSLNGSSSTIYQISQFNKTAMSKTRTDII